MKIACIYLTIGIQTHVNLQASSLQQKNKLRLRSFPVDFAKYLRTPPGDCP